VEGYLMSSNWRTTVNDDGVTVIYQSCDGRTSIAEAYCVCDGQWNIARVNVDKSQRLKGIGRELVQRIVEAVSTKEHFRQLKVQPGGYKSDPVELEAFYTKCGFKTLSPYPLLDMEWKP